MDFSELEKLIKFLTENKISEFYYEDNKNKIKIKASQIGIQKTISQSYQPQPRQLYQQQQPAPQLIYTTAPKPTNNYYFVKAPLPGNFYDKPGPDEKPYVEIGQIIDTGKIMCIIEAMKVMNEIHYDGLKGVLEEILVKNKSAVETGQDLFKIKIK